MKGLYTPCLEIVQRVFSKYENIKIVEGVVPNILDSMNVEKIAFVHIDMNAVKPELAATNFCWDKLVKGGYIILDDYGHRPHKKLKIALDMFAKKHSRKVLSLPTGQGMIIKN